MTTTAATRPSRSLPRLLTVLTAVVGLLAGLTGTASASTDTQPGSSSRLTHLAGLETRVGVAATPPGLFVGPQTPGSPAGIGEIGCGYDGITVGSCVATNSLSAADEIANAASGAQRAVGPGKGPVYGTKVHTEFANQLKALGRSDIYTEVSYLNGRVVPYGTPGSVRLDAVVGSPGAPSAIYDLKTGSASLSPSRVAQIQSHLPPGYQNIPVLEVRP